MWGKRGDGSADGGRVLGPVGGSVGPQRGGGVAGGECEDEEDGLLFFSVCSAE